MNNHSLLRQAQTALSQDDLLDLAGELIGTIGLERLSCGALAERADLSHEQVFRFFKDRGTLIDRLVDRLYQRQTEALNIWFGRFAARSQAFMAEHVEDLMLSLFAASASVAGAAQLHQALHGQASLAPRRKAMRTMIADRFADAVAKLTPGSSRDALWPRYRMAVEMALSTETLALMPGDAKRVPNAERLAREGARVLRLALETA